MLSLVVVVVVVVILVIVSSAIAVIASFAQKDLAIWIYCIWFIDWNYHEREIHINQPPFIYTLFDGISPVMVDLQPLPGRQQ